MWHHLLQEYKTPLHPHWDERRARGSTQLQSLPRPLGEGWGEGTEVGWNRERASRPSVDEEAFCILEGGDAT